MKQPANTRKQAEKGIRQKTVFQKEYEELQVAFRRNQEEKDKKKFLQEELQRIRVSYRDVCRRYETDAINVRQQADILQRVLQKDIPKVAFSKKIWGVASGSSKQPGEGNSYASEGDGKIHASPRRNEKHQGFP